MFFFSLQILSETCLILWGMLRNTKWSKSLCAPDDYNPHTADDLKMAVTEYIRNMDRAILNTVFDNTVRRVNKCLQTGGGHFEHYL